MSNISQTSGLSQNRSSYENSEQHLPIGSRVQTANSPKSSCLITSLTVIALLLWANYIFICLKYSNLRKEKADFYSQQNLVHASHGASFYKEVSQEEVQKDQQAQLKHRYEDYTKKQIDRTQLKPVDQPLDLPKVTEPMPTHTQSVWHRDGIKKFRYPVLGISEPGSIFNYTVVQKKSFKQFDREILSIFEPFSETDCEKSWYGGFDQGWVLCKNIIKYSEALVNLGKTGSDTFGCELTSNNSMPNYQYHCSGQETKCSSNKGMNLLVHACTGQVSQNIPGKVFYSLADIIKAHSLIRKHRILKLDIKGRQYSTLRYFPVEQLAAFDQIVAKLHFDGYPFEFWGNIDIFRSLSKHFIPVFFQDSNSECFSQETKTDRQLRSRDMKVTLVNKHLITKRSQAVHLCKRESINPQKCRQLANVDNSLNIQITKWLEAHQQHCFNYLIRIN